MIVTVLGRPPSFGRAQLPRTRPHRRAAAARMFGSRCGGRCERPSRAPSFVRREVLARHRCGLAIIFLGRAIAYDVEVWGSLSLHSPESHRMNSLPTRPVDRPEHPGLGASASGCARPSRRCRSSSRFTCSRRRRCSARSSSSICGCSGFPNTRRPFTRVSDELLKLTWAAFCLAARDGLADVRGEREHVHHENTAFQLQDARAAVAAGLNMADLPARHVPHRGCVEHGRKAVACGGASVAGMLSILLWLTVIFLARWIGFTKGYHFEVVPDNVDFNFQYS